MIIRGGLDVGGLLRGQLTLHDCVPWMAVMHVRIEAEFRSGPRALKHTSIHTGFRAPKSGLFQQRCSVEVIKLTVRDMHACMHARATVLHAAGTVRDRTLTPPQARSASCETASTFHLARRVCAQIASPSARHLGGARSRHMRKSERQQKGGANRWTALGHVGLGHAQEGVPQAGGNGPPHERLRQ